MQQPYTTPKLGLSAFNCPHCRAYAKQSWQCTSMALNMHDVGAESYPIATACCQHCSEFSLWFKRMLCPPGGNAPLPHPDLPEDVKADYEEAASIAGVSQRGAAALLRLAMQKLCVDLGGKGDNLNADIGQLVEKGLSKQIQESLDVVRVTGNNAVHPGQIEVADTNAADSLFALVNVIVETMIAQPKHIAKLYEGLPDSSKDQIDRRDGAEAPPK